MTNILTSEPTYKPGTANNFGPARKDKRATSINSSNRNSRQRDLGKIMAENEHMLKRLQEQKSAYNVSTWESERKLEIARIKLICRYEPSLTGESNLRFRRKKNNSNAEPNRQLFDLYQKSIREGSIEQDMANFSIGGGMSSVLSDAATKQNQQTSRINQLENESIQLPDIISANDGLQTANHIVVTHEQFINLRNDYAKRVPGFQVQNAMTHEDFMIQRESFVDKIEKSNFFGARKQSRTQGGSRPSNKIQYEIRDPLPHQLIPQSVTNLSKIKAENSQVLSQETSNLKPVNIIARKRPPPLNIGYNELGIEQKRAVLYRNFHEISRQVYLIEISRNKKKVFILMFANFENPNKYIAEVLLQKIAMKLMNDCGNVFENFIQQFYIKFGKLQIQGYHNKTNRSIAANSDQNQKQIQETEGFQLSQSKSPVSQQRQSSDPYLLIGLSQNNKNESILGKSMQNQLIAHQDEQENKIKDREEPSFAPEDDQVQQKIETGQMEIASYNLVPQESNVSSEYISTPGLIQQQTRLNEDYKKSNNTMGTQQMSEHQSNVHIETPMFLMNSATEQGTFSPKTQLFSQKDLLSVTQNTFIPGQTTNAFNNSAIRENEEAQSITQNSQQV